MALICLYKTAQNMASMVVVPLKEVTRILYLGGYTLQFQFMGWRWIVSHKGQRYVDTESAVSDEYSPCG